MSVSELDFEFLLLLYIECLMLAGDPDPTGISYFGILCIALHDSVSNDVMLNS